MEAEWKTEATVPVGGDAGVRSPLPAYPVRAVIDVGTNSVKILVAEVRGQAAYPLLERSTQTRLGHGFYETNRLQPEAIAHTAAAVLEFSQLARAHQATSLRVVATSAARDAHNADELIQALQTASGVPLDIISGDQEADWAFRGVCSDPRYTGLNLLIMDVGGGSTEFILGSQGVASAMRSFPLGTVRFLERLAPGDPPSVRELAQCRAAMRAFLAAEVQPWLQPLLAALPEQPCLVGTGGTTTILARVETRAVDFDRQDLESVRLRRDQVTGWMEHLWAQPLAVRRQVVGLPPNRADVILMGVAIYEAVMEMFGLPELSISTRGLRFAAVLAG
jgi:exopolyphosphatase/guanosine-5'-triphosphate,3'-diphosphate pyrophosphatase